MAGAVAERVPADTHCELHLYSQATIFRKDLKEYGPTLPFLTSQNVAEHSRQMGINIQALIKKHDPVKLILVAHSTGTAILRHAIATISRLNIDNEHQKKERRWTSLIDRIIHIGGMTTGWEFNSEIPKLYLWLGPIIRPLCPDWFPWQIYKGSKFITETRISLSRQYDSNRKMMPIQPQEDFLLGTKDEYVTPADAIETGGILAAGNPKYIEVSGCTHRGILSDNKGRVNENVRIYIEQVLVSNAQKLPPGFRIIEADDIDDYLDPLDNEPARRDVNVNHVIIIMHGIRDGGTWAKRIGNIIKDIWRDESKLSESRNVRVVSPTYGYFSIWDFVRPGGRRRAVDWYQNIYANVCALYPSAKVSFLGHSNGTYLGTQALQCENLDYKYMILAGSVVRQDFWLNKKTGKNWKQRVSRLYNFRSIDDWIVALLPGGLEVVPLLGWFMNLGGAGAYGFRGIDEVREQRTIKGGHGAAIQADTWEQLARFLINDDVDLNNRIQPGEQGHLAPVTPNHEPLLWSINKFLYLTKVIRLVGGLLILAAIIACFLPLIAPLLVVTGLPMPYILFKYPMASMLAIVAASGVAFSCLKNI